MKLNKEEFVISMFEINDPGVLPKRSTFELYELHGQIDFITLQIHELWLALLHCCDSGGNRISLFELYRGLTTCEDDFPMIKSIFEKVNNRSKQISFIEFENFLLRIDDEDFFRIMHSLEIEYIPESEPDSEPEPEPEPEPENEIELEPEPEKDMDNIDFILIDDDNEEIKSIFARLFTYFQNIF